MGKNKLNYIKIIIVFAKTLLYLSIVLFFICLFLMLNGINSVNQVINLIPNISKLSLVFIGIGLSLLILFDDDENENGFNNKYDGKDEIGYT